MRTEEEKIAALEEAATKALAILTGSDREFALVDYLNRPNFTICDMLRKALELPAQDRISDSETDSEG